MNTKDLIRLGVPVGEPIRLAHEFIQSFIAQGNDGALLEGEIFNVVANPPAFFADELRAPMARAIYRPAFTPRAELPLRRLRGDRSAFVDVRFRAWRSLRRRRGHRVPHEVDRL